MPSDLHHLFLLRDDVTFLNHGSFGACPRSVFERYQQWQLESERQPVEFFGRRAPELLAAARAALGNLLGAEADDLVYVPNATTAVNIVARSLDLGPGDEVLGTDHEYGACDRVWRLLSRKSGFTYRRATIPVPTTTHEDLVETLFSQVSSSTRVLFVSHITSPTALTFPITEICRRARELGIITVVDGAHVPGQLHLDLESVGADFYTGNLHKWLCAPKGAAFLYARRQMQPLLEPLIVSWGWEALAPGASTFIDHHEYTGTRDFSAALAVPDAIEFQRRHDWERVRQECHEIVRRARPLMLEALDATPLSPDSDEWYMQMCAVLLPADVDGFELKRRLYDEHRVEIPVAWWNDRQTFRISIQGYNDWSDVERLIEAIEIEVGRVKGEG